MSDVDYLILILGSKCAQIHKTCSDIHLLGAGYNEYGHETTLEHLRTSFNEAVAIAEMLADRSVDLCHDHQIITDYSKMVSARLKLLQCT